MDNIRLFLWMGLGLLIWLSFQAWQQDYAPAPTAIDTVSQMSADSPEAPLLTDDLPGLPETTMQSGDISDSAGAIAAQLPAGTISAGKTIRVRTDVQDLQINLLGGDLVAASLPTYPVHKDDPDNPVRLLSPNPAELFVFGTGLRSLDGAAEPTHQSLFTAEQNEYVLPDGQDELVVTLSWKGDGGVSGQKIYRFRRGSYAIELQQVLTNDGPESYRAVSYAQIKRKYIAPDRSMFNVDSYSFIGPVIYDGEKYEKIDADDLRDEPLEQLITSGWIASIQHHFLAAIVPTAKPMRKYTGTYDGTNTLVRIIDTEVTTIEPGSQATFESALFVGPKLQSQLEGLADGLQLTVDYGLLTILAQPLFWLLQTIFDYIGNWGWTIIIVTFLIKLVFYKLTEKSGRSMAKMRKLAPRLKSVQERHKGDREALSRAMMDLYKREKVNPAAGCWPMLIQIPFFIAFYWVLLESVEMRQAPFMLWITDLSTRDPFFILPLLMGAAMYFQQKLNPPPPDPMQAKVMQFLPIAFTAMFAFFPAGLVLYWLTNSVLSMAQQWRINKVLGAD